MSVQAAILAERARQLALREARVPGRTVFEGPAAQRLFANVEQVAVSFASANEMLEHAAHAIRHQANEIRDAQETWNHRRYALDSQLVDLDERERRLAS